VWKQIFQLAVGDTIKGVDANKTIKSIADIGVGPVVKLEVEAAHTYISAGLISHNKIAVDIEKILTTYGTGAF
jgi:intein/homing endonuclease